MLQQQHVQPKHGQMQLYLEMLVCKHVGKKSTSTWNSILPLKKNQQKTQQKKQMKDIKYYTETTQLNCKGEISIW